MNENIHLGRVVGETEAFVDIELCGHDVRNLLAVHASQCFDFLAPEIRNFYTSKVLDKTEKQ